MSDSANSNMKISQLSPEIFTYLLEVPLVFLYVGIMPTEAKWPSTSPILPGSKQGPAVSPIDFMCMLDGLRNKTQLDANQQPARSMNKSTIWSPQGESTVTSPSIGPRDGAIQVTCMGFVDGSYRSSSQQSSQLDQENQPLNPWKQYLQPSNAKFNDSKTNGARLIKSNESIIFAFFDGIKAQSSSPLVFVESNNSSSSSDLRAKRGATSKGPDSERLAKVILELANNSSPEKVQEVRVDDLLWRALSSFATASQQLVDTAVIRVAQDVPKRISNFAQLGNNIVRTLTVDNPVINESPILKRARQRAGDNRPLVLVTGTSFRAPVPVLSGAPADQSSTAREKETIDRLLSLLVQLSKNPIGSSDGASRLEVSPQIEGISFTRRTKQLSLNGTRESNDPGSVYGNEPGTVRPANAERPMNGTRSSRGNSTLSWPIIRLRAKQLID